MTATATAAVKFQVTLNVTDLARSARFYCAMLGVKPAMLKMNAGSFELEEPPLVLGLAQGKQAPGGSLNHVGFRLADSAALVEVQRRLEEAGFPTQSQEGVECCYALQTKIWVTDPDCHLWELYVLEHDLDHSGFEDAPRPAPTPGATAIVWEHRLMEPVPERLAHGDGSVDEVRLEGSFNASPGSFQPGALLIEALRVLKPGGKIAVHGLVSAEPLAKPPVLPGLAALVQHVPTASEIGAQLRDAGFAGLFYEKLSIPCLQVPGVELFEMRLLAWRPYPGPARHRHLLYKGPLAQVRDEDGTVYPRGQSVTVTADTWQRLHDGPAAGQFLLFPCAAE